MATKILHQGGKYEFENSRLLNQHQVLTVQAAETNCRAGGAAPPPHPDSGRGTVTHTNKRIATANFGIPTAGEQKPPAIVIAG